MAALHHIHLPKPGDAHVISYDTETNTVTPERVDAVASYVLSEFGET